ncbi:MULTISPECIES: hypothetical protein [Cupriavidus]|uniref:Uncharacterized protein n=1 Tax=Cupriavidus oxalaticus TaxID=96344 RepID=A0A4P7LGV8_9BURK|nr:MULTISPECIES: hypothetical protein [Cupriavidus]MBF6988911.1 hypothetical protein [Cupriavidus sp. IK-TO18]QBY55340.1 hypothetical protein E0W60_30135 [Cupriavidus oxalaticus]TDF66992.1 hypothetical protein E1J61_05490 [Cupriavidus sp. L7L]
MEFDSDWMTLGKHRVRIRCVRGFPTEKTRSVAELARIAIENNLSAAARLVEVTADSEKTYTISVGTTFPKDRDVAPHLDVALATMFGLKSDQVNFDVVVVSQAEVDLHFGVYERMLAEKLGIVPSIQ